MNLIPTRIRKAYEVDARKNDPFQEWLREEIRKDDAVIWGKMEEPAVVMSFPEKIRHYKFISRMLP